MEYSEKFKMAGFSEVMEQKRFVMFKIMDMNGRKTKVPFQTNGKPAKSTDSLTWATFKECEETLKEDLKLASNRFSGIGIILGDFFGTKIVGIDIDHCIDGISGEWTNEYAKEAVSNLRSYAERSISGTGFHCLMKDVSVPDGYKTRTSADSRFDLEVYETGRYFTISFDRIGDNPLSQDSDGLDKIVRTYLPKRVGEVCSSRNYTKPLQCRPSAIKPQGLLPEVNEYILQNISFKDVWNGKRSGNESKDDFYILSTLVKILHTKDKEIILGQFRNSPFYKTKDNAHLYKIDKRGDYIDRTLVNAATGVYFPFSLDDIGNSDMYCEQYGGVIKYVHEWNEWVAWNGSYWEKGAELKSRLLAKDMIKDFRAGLKNIESYKSSADMSNEEVSRLAAIKKHASNMGYANRISALLSLSQASLDSSAELFDNDPMCINLKNGYFNLQSQTFLPSDSKYMCTNVAGYNRAKEGDCPKFKEFLRKILPQDDVREFFEQCVGMAMVGRVYEEVMVFLVGDGCNGKSTLANILSSVLGTYATSIQPDVLTTLSGCRTPPDIAEVRGKRLVFISETEEGDTLSTKALKRLCSNEKLSVRRLYCMPECFTPSHTVFYSTNHKPRVTSSDNGTWRRIRIIPFTYQFSDKEKITDFSDKLLAEEGEQILNWCLGAAKKFIDNGMKLKTPASIMNETMEYKENEDVMAQFVNENVVIKNPSSCMYEPIESRRVKSSVVYTVYKNWCKQNNFPAKNVSIFNSEFSKKTGSLKRNISGVKYWYDVSLNS